MSARAPATLKPEFLNTINYCFMKKNKPTPPTREEIQKAKKVLGRAGLLIRALWSWEDVQLRAADNGIKLSNKQSLEILQTIGRKHDCNIGINWDVIDDYVNEYLTEKVKL